MSSELQIVKRCTVAAGSWVDFDVGKSPMVAVLVKNLTGSDVLVSLDGIPDDDSNAILIKTLTAEVCSVSIDKNVPFSKLYIKATSAGDVEAQAVVW